MVRFWTQMRQDYRYVYEKDKLTTHKMPSLKRWGSPIVILEVVKLWNGSKQRFWSEKYSYYQNLRSIGRKWEETICKIWQQKATFLVVSIK